jgi:Txe/YoeB family toxin of Txe-Axe toxin-antitoxin module
MPTLEASRRFLRAYQKATTRDRDRAERINRALELFRTDPDHPSLNFERLAGSDLFSIRVNRGDRIILRRRDGDRFELVDVGSHDIYRRYP